MSVRASMQLHHVRKLDPELITQGAMRAELRAIQSTVIMLFVTRVVESCSVEIAW